ncbi:MAG: large protein [Phycisphaerales bacterium]|nr:large protein [Phycisphaerales bacterium]
MRTALRARSRPAPIAAATAAAAALALLPAAQRRAAADITGFDAFAPINETRDDLSTTTYNGYYADPDNGGTMFQVTASGISGQAVSGFATTRQDATNFVAKYTYLATGGSADAVGFVIQNDTRGLTARGNGGGDAGFSGPAGAGVKPGVGYFISPYYANADGTLKGATAISVDAAVGKSYFYNGAVNTRDNHPVDVAISYSAAAGTMFIKLTDVATGATYYRSDSVDVPTAIAGTTGYVGFTGGTGGATATQKVSKFTFDSRPAPTGTAYAPIGVTGFTKDVIVEAGATSMAAAVTARFDASNRWGLFQKGQNAANPTAGLPLDGVVTSSATDATHTFRLASAAGNNAIQLNGSTPAGTLVLTDPVAYTGLSILASTGNGSGAFDVRVVHSNGAPDEVVSMVIAPDWFNRGGYAMTGGGRVRENSTTGAFEYDNLNAANPRLYQQDVPLTDTTSPISRLEMTYVAGAGDTFVFGVSGVPTFPVPEPASAGLLAAGGLAALGRRRRGRAS